MSISPDFSNHVADLLSTLGHVRIKKMFGGGGVYCDDVIIAIIVDDVLYLKVDDINRPDFKAAELEPFTYEARGKRTSMSYYRAPEEALDSAGIMQSWARGALAAALRARKTAKPKRAKPPK
ncbi:MAG TPA: TfoX/Sxy family protein [Rhodocyclaceae bacterium]|nr:TfoX/Sxy family protein [Rhodocyclaceae bacterium]